MCKNKLIQRFKLNPEEFFLFGSFLRLPKSGKLSSEKLCKKRFIEIILLGNKRLMVKDLGTQLCTTAIGKLLGRNPQTISNWIKELVKAKILVSVNRNWKKGFRSKSFAINFNNQEVVDLMNKFTGYSVSEEKKEISTAKFEIRTLAWAKVDPFCYTMKDVLRVAQCYLGCEKQFLKDIFRKIPIEILQSPREKNIKEIKVYDFYWAFRLVTKNSNDRGLNYLNILYKRSVGFKKFLGRQIDKFKYLEFNYDESDIEQIDYIDEHNDYCLKVLKSRMWAAVEIGAKKIFNRLKQMQIHLTLVQDYWEEPGRLVGHRMVGGERAGSGRLLTHRKVRSENWWINWEMMQN